MIMNWCSAVMLLALMAGQAAFASDAEFVIIVAADNPVDHLAAHEIVDMYLGRSARFPDGRPVAPVEHKYDSAAKEAFYRNLLQQNPAQVRAHWSRLVFTGRGKPPRQAGSSIELVEIVARNPNAIGYVEPGFIDESVRIIRVDP